MQAVRVDRRGALLKVLIANAHGMDTTVGGAERYVADLAIGLARRGHEITVISAFPQTSKALSAPVEVITLHDADWRRDRLRRALNHVGDVLSLPASRLEAVVASVDPDLIHTCNLPGIGTGVWEVARRRAVSVLHTLHDYQLLCPRVSLERRDGTPCRPSPLFCGLRTRRMIRWGGAVGEVIAGSEYLLDLHRRLFAPTVGRVIRLPLQPLEGGSVPPPNDPPRTLGYLGSLERAKGIEVILESASELARLGVKVQIAGDGRLRPEVEAAAARGVSYLGHVGRDAKRRFLAATDIAIVPSRWAEPSGPPYVVLEWLAAGRPVLVSGRGGLAEVARLPGVVMITPDRLGVVTAVQRLLEGAFRPVVSSITPVQGHRDLVRWLDEHEAAYAAASR